MESQEYKKPERERPLSVTLLVICGASIALVPLALFVFAYEQMNQLLDISIFFVLINVCLSFLILYSAVGTWQGKQESMHLFLGLLFVWHVLQIIDVILLLRSLEVVEDSVRQKANQIVIRDVLTIVMYAYFFTRPKVKQFFSREG